MRKGICRILYIPEWVTFKWCKEQKEKYHLFLEDYAEVLNESISNIVEEAGVDLYDALQSLKNDGIFHIDWNFEENKKMMGLYGLLAFYEVYKYQYESGGKEDMFINLNTTKERTKEKLSLLIMLDKMKEEKK